MNSTACIDATSYSRLRWRCRRGLLENELIIHRWLDAQQGKVRVQHAQALQALLQLADNDLLDLLLQRKQPEGALDTPAVQQLLADMHAMPAN